MKDGLFSQDTPGTPKLSTSQNPFARKVPKGAESCLILAATAILLGVGIYGNVLLRQKFDPTWFLPSDTYLAKWFVANAKYFPFGGDRVTIWCSDLDYFNEFDKLSAMAKRLAQQNDIIDKVDDWMMEFEDYGTRNKLMNNVTDLNHFNGLLTQFLFSPTGGRYRQQFKFEEELVCGSPAPKLSLSQITFQHRIFTGPEEHVPGLYIFLRCQLLLYIFNPPSHESCQEYQR